MKKFNNFLLAKLAVLTKSSYAALALFSISFLQAMCLPVAIDFLLVPMMILRPTKAQFYVFLVIAGVVSGGIGGYFLGKESFEVIIAPIINNYGYMRAFEHANSLFANYGAWILVISGVIPLPYMIFPLTAGVLQLSFVKFIIASLGGRVIRYGAVWLLFKFGFNFKLNYKV